MGLLTKIFGGNGDGPGPSAEAATKANGKPNAAAPPARPSAPALEPQRSPAPRVRHTAEAVRRALESQKVQQGFASVPKNGVPKSDESPAGPLGTARVRSPLIVSATSLSVDELLAPTGRAPLPTLNGGFTLPDGSSVHNDSTWARTGLGPPPPAVPSAATALTPAAEPEPVSDAVRAALELLVDLGFRLALGPISEDWLQAGARASHTLELAARRGWEPHLLASFEALGRLLAEGARTRALPVVWRLSDSVPDWPAPARNLRETARRRERRLVSEILLGVDGLREHARSSFVREKTLAHLVAATPEQLAEQLATPVERARELARLVSRYEAERRTRPVDLGHRTALQHAALALEQRQCEFEACDEDPREARQERRQALWRVSLILAERGDLELLDELEPLAVSERIERLRPLIDPGAEPQA
ncbi:MAG: hypothetical protein ABI895_14520 [Deltaproteobacteria bacterium]